MDYYKSFPYVVKVELVEGCNRLCDFCAINTIWQEKKDRVIKTMAIELASAIAKDLGSWLGKRRIEFSLRGEPTMHPKVMEAVSLFREHNPSNQLLMYSNGIIPRKKGAKFLQELFKAGINIMIMDTYDHREECVEVVKESGIHYFDYYKDQSFNPYYNHEVDTKVIVVMDDIGKRNGDRVTRVVTNLAGNIPPVAAHKYGAAILAAPLKKMCGRPFKEFVIHQNGVVPICCVDWRDECILGKFPEDGTLQEIWFSDIFNVFRYRLRNKNRNMLPCDFCDYNGGFRLGLLPKFGVDFSEEEIDKMISWNYRKYDAFSSKYAREQKIFEPEKSGIRAILNRGKI
jgi:MoaA/NifB/PqqE/SkfB family radical SAM enzyme